MQAAGNMNLSIIVISYNTKEITKNCLDSISESLKGSSINYEVIIVDNASNDGTVNKIKNLKLKIRNLNLIQNNKNIGFAKANNQAVKQSKGNYLLFLNSDIVVLDNAIEKMFLFYKENEKTVHFLGGKLLNKDKTPQPSAGPFYSLPVVFGALFLKGDYWGLTRYSPNRLKKVDWVSGACILARKSYFEDVNGFDENIFMYMEELDLLYRARQSGYQTYFYPEAHFIHLGSASSNGKTYPILQVFKGFLFFYNKHHKDGFSQFFLRFMLKLKSLIALMIGKITGNQYLLKTYEEAYKLARLAEATSKRAKMA
ncbi:MAG: Glycosyltransferase/rhamnosyltransferase [Candidatus Roizmanbacteria bacterium GW2011_GWA2_36_23]|uniref:Glycosyltransferase/rhamnosyltransferase n=1 Tax=Candidatus Roizmanbacteria bacterium GW2011_GWA2_36_23 TaxID=1618480 RepID=A0A0G0E8P9_9BACT|nr:MAG: Glycosyltransferase/rhamnosyltransferase [Candidatus Roizmanbacteria bacterium GW2011_GWA2_36_23]